VAIASTGGAQPRPPSVFLSLLPPATDDRRLALSLCAASIVIFIVLVPLAKTPLAQVPAFIPLYQSALFVTDAMTAAVLLGQFAIQRTRSLLVLALAYLFASMVVVAHTLSFPGLFAPGGLMGSGPQTTVWLYMLWHAGFPVLVMAYVLLKEDQRPVAAPARVAGLAFAAALLTVLGFVALATVGHGLLPALLLPDNTYTVAMQVVIVSVWALGLMALAVLWRARPHAKLDLWLMVVMVAWVCDVGLSATFNAKRFDFGFYAGRVYGLMASSFVLAMLLLETQGLYTRLARRLDARRAAAEDRAAAAQRMSHETAETLRAVIDASSLAIFALSPTGIVLLWNKTAERLFGHASDEIIGKPNPLIPEERGLQEEQHAVFERALGGAVLRDVEMQCRRKDGSVSVLLGSAGPFHAASGALSGVAFALEDLTEKRTTEDMLRQAQKMEAVGQLTGGVAHDFNNILMVILANVEELLEDESLSGHQRGMLDSIATSGQRAAELTRRLLAFSRKQPLHPQPTSLADLVAGIDQMLRRTLGERIEISVAIANELWTTIIDRAQLESALLNLCVNARDAMPDGGKLLIECANAELDHDYARANAGVLPGQYVMLAVSDSGSGMAPEVLRKVFEPFFTTKGVGKGTGLGLSMVYGFVKQSNGHIKIYSEIGQGTTVRVYLPRHMADGAAVAPDPGTPMPGGSQRILLIEDDPQVRSAVLVQLSSLGYEVVEAASADAGLALLDAGEHFDMILTDLVMPGMNGQELAAVLSDRFPSIRILFMSGYSEMAASSHGHFSGRARLLSKPFRKIDLARSVRATLDAGAGGIEAGGIEAGGIKAGGADAMKPILH
jgi:PAS domain S-box-containing protein